MRISHLAGAALLLAALSAAPAAASTLAESAIPGGDFSGIFTDFSYVDQGVTSVSGTWYGSNDYDFIAFTGLASGAQTVTLTFSPIPPLVDGYSGGGMVQWSDSPLLYSAWEGDTLGGVNLVAGSFDPITLVLTLGDTFAGELYLSLLGTNSYPVSYTISAPGNAVESNTMSAVPLPATAPLLIGGIAALGGLGAWRRRSRKA